MTKFIIFLLFFSTQLFAESIKEIFIQEPVFNASVYVKIAGDPKKPAVVLVHGLGDEASTIWENTINILKENYFVITLDLPGFGKSSKSNELYSPENYAKCIHYICQLYLQRPFHLIGHSMGGAVSLKYTQMYPKDVESLVLIDVAGILSRSAYSNLLIQHGINKFFDEQNNFVQKIHTQKLDNLIYKITEKIDKKITLDMKVILASKNLRNTVLGGIPSSIAAIAMLETNFNGILQNILQPTTIIWGEEDGIAPLQTSYVLKKLIPNSHLVIIPYAEHVPMLSHEKDFSEKLLTHFKNLNTKEKINNIEKTTFGSPYDIEIKNIYGKTVTGAIKNMTIQNSHKIVIKNALIEELLIINSEVEIVNCTFQNLNNVTFTAQNSKVLIAASDINGKLKLSNTKLHLAGVIVNTRENPIEIISNSTIDYSLSQVNNILIHGRTF